MSGRISGNGSWACGLHLGIGMAHQHTNDFYPAAEIPKRHMPWFTQMLMAFALLVLAAVIYAFWNMGKAPARTLEVPALEQPANGPGSNPPEDRPQRDSPMPSPVTPTPAPIKP
jgi:hypothetical protein